MSTGGVSKDTWIIAPSRSRPGPRAGRSRLPQVDLRDSVTSSTASAMYWIGRNHERAETIVRLVRSIDETLGMWPELRDEAGGSWLQLMGAAVHAVVDDDHDGPPTVDAALVAALGDPRHARSLVTSLQYLLVGGRSVRERLSPDAWRMLADLEELHPELEHASPIEARELADATIAPLSALSGLMTEAMVRDAGWRFLDLGRRIERSSLMCRLLTATMGAPPPETIAAPVYETILAGWECLGAYRRRHRSDVERPAMFALLFTDASNPRSLRFQVERMSDDVGELPPGHDHDRMVTVVEGLGAELEDLGPAQLAQLDDAGRHHRLQQLLGRVHTHLDALEEIVELGYFAQVGPGTVLGTEAMAPHRRGRG
jgi:uncharacterized alpha-E superfamily protein